MFTIQHVVYVIKQSVSPKIYVYYWEMVYYSGVYYYQSPLYNCSSVKRSRNLLLLANQMGSTLLYMCCCKPVQPSLLYCKVELMLPICEMLCVLILLGSILLQDCTWKLVKRETKWVILAFQIRQHCLNFKFSNLR